MTNEAQQARQWWVYVIVSYDSKRTYVGVTIDPIRRLDEHNGVRRNGAKSTRNGRPWRIHAVHGPYDGQSTALRIEALIKRLPANERLLWQNCVRSVCE